MCAFGLVASFFISWLFEGRDSMLEVGSVECGVCAGSLKNKKWRDWWCRYCTWDIRVLLPCPGCVALVNRTRESLSGFNFRLLELVFELVDLS